MSSATYLGRSVQDGVQIDEMKSGILAEALARLIGLVIVGVLVAFAHLLNWRNSYQDL